MAERADESGTAPKRVPSRINEGTLVNSNPPAASRCSSILATLSSDSAQSTNLEASNRTKNGPAAFR